MEIIVGTIILKNDKILMVKEAKKDCYSKWSFPAGHLEKKEMLIEGAKRETLEESGCIVEIKKAFPILVSRREKEDVLIIYFLADLVEEKFSYDANEILETKWLTIDEIKNMDEQEFRSYPVVKKILESIETNDLYKIDIFKDLNNI